MQLDQELLNAPPIINPYIETGFKTYPVYAKQDLLRAHKQRLHIQPGIEMNLTLEGKAAYVIGNTVYKQSPGQLIVFSGHIPHQVYIDPSCQYKRAIICFDESLLRKECEFHSMPALDFCRFTGPNYRQIDLDPEMFANVRWIISRITEEMKERTFGWKQVVSSQLISLAVYISRIPQSNDRREDEDPLRLYCEFIDNHLHEELSLQSAARLFHVSPEHLTRQFKREKGLSFYQYVLQRRVLETKRLLQNYPNMSLTEIAFTAGFTSSAQFSRVFKTATGMLPSRYRRLT
ncbi:MAG: AraC family transcriptional regulator [Paenibacillus sp.]|jgi:AraC-like DNA-binding protein|nr:AraC family transcriptional regulator [Paenibacillus sp.]